MPKIFRFLAAGLVWLLITAIAYGGTALLIQLLHESCAAHRHTIEK